jgi:hypothetical protein
MTPMHSLRTYVTGDEKSGCVWFAESGTDELRAVLWPEGFRAAFDPVRIYNPEGRVVWREGVEMSVSGGPSTVHVDRIPPACRTGDLAWWMPRPLNW